jgi:hypothetical protein
MKIFKKLGHKIFGINSHLAIISKTVNNKPVSFSKITDLENFHEIFGLADDKSISMKPHFF